MVAREVLFENHPLEHSAEPRRELARQADTSQLSAACRLQGKYSQLNAVRPTLDRSYLNRPAAR